MFSQITDVITGLIQNSGFHMGIGKIINDNHCMCTLLRIVKKYEPLLLYQYLLVCCLQIFQWQI